jgi:hypothetical protein
MAKFTSEKYPSLRVSLPDGSSVKFVDGEAEATGDAAKALKGLHADYGVAEVKSRAKSDD